ncbi:hypothetical protein [Tissierella sp. Yu-01]|uniref:hypothetical protein n=1 Tax=Tissierella sp. Yu-01 TaxID=3035694 RepID=UPI00240E1E54|nr:hypothetical protein [Tissierella sp. Yu-01]WFA09201.1 hypothetical protein P3962_01115 [Tissierella sp. Yu-01]
MKFYYSSMYIHERINSFEELIEKIDGKLIELYLDTNICIYLRDYYKEPSSIVKRDEVWAELRTLLKHIKTRNLKVDFSFGVEEACRNKSNFEINYEKLVDMNYSIEELFNMDYFEMVEHSKLLKFDTQVKDTTKKKPSKMNSLESLSRFQNLLFVNYACLLKMYLLDKKREEKSNVQLMIEFLNFVEQEVDVFSTSIVIFAHYFFSGSSLIKRLIHRSKQVAEEKVHALWNAAIDLTFPPLVSKQILKSKSIPVFVTADQTLCLIFDAMKIRVMISDGDKSTLPPFVEVDLSKTCWSAEELREIDKYYDEIMKIRKYKFAFNEFDQERVLENLRAVCKKLEDELNSIL